jgi:methyltransferase (TIGR00027 family)
MVNPASGPEARDIERRPDATAVITALWRAAHLRLDASPHVLEDDIGLRLVRDTDVIAAYLGPEATVGPDAWLRHPFMDDKFRRWRASLVARARLVEDIVAEQIDRGCDQYVILGAGLDSFALRRLDLVGRLRVFEVDEPRTQAWKRRRFKELDLAPPATLSFVPVDFERQAWIAEIIKAGFDRAGPAVVSSLGVTQYLSVDAVQAMLGDVARLGPRSLFVCSFVLAPHFIEPDEQAMRAETEARASKLGHPWLSSFPPAEIRGLAERAGFPHVRLVTPEDLAGRYFAGRTDGLRPSSQNAYLIASTRSE